MLTYIILMVVSFGAGWVSRSFLIRMPTPYHKGGFCINDSRCAQEREDADEY